MKCDVNIDKLQVAGFLDNSLANGKGLRSVLFLSGCIHNCKGCHNKLMQDFSYGEKVSLDNIILRIKRNMPLIKGVTFSGGEPFEQADKLSKLSKLVKKENLNIWCYTGYTFEYILNNMNNNGWKELINNVDILVDGRFEEDKVEQGLKYKGSSNQRIINVRESFKKNKIIMYNLD
ncbi:anaerobic ribonucleoside-triphosphate reductase activating protein [Clostridium tetanomorphum]|uniref:Anaerobic ribonucleoside-triphosphate reductase-activating protein n=2 Tax=Clostridium tetanomorphum TaxID=1553 RepID=A0A923EDB3_CLOTT|nr:anaerobic ribonucleoside-triphosphate reductase activating protein [Clostridium tetanomorphum]KAJ49862.1 anaerobic ribonucleoside-triphosphate reductase activating protein [Clostridium tetanomorphum DSM 665]MBC2399316.1 anaerobic ribonucleoside-triphosphate reductase activating protein [Clostridium tetanomorphum]MBP1866121.1 anaerobic ribonucleoside-triphosphate reductase activating protein [Clostridium tetanomorphum]NRS86749.1 anaerobic ribonucleoside-triphosphate reductase activating prote